MFFKKKYQLVKNKTLKEYNEKYKEYFKKHPDAKKEIKILTLDDIAENKKILNKHGWWLIDGKFYQIPDGIYKRNAMIKKYATKGVKKVGKKARKSALASMGVTTKVIIGSVVGVAVAAGVAVPVVVVNVVSKKNTNVVKIPVSVDAGSDVTLVKNEIELKDEGAGILEGELKAKKGFLRIVKLMKGDVEIDDNPFYYTFDSYHNTLIICDDNIKEDYGSPAGNYKIIVSNAILSKGIKIGTDNQHSIFTGAEAQFPVTLTSDESGTEYNSTIDSVKWTILSGYEGEYEAEVEILGDEISNMFYIRGKKPGRLHFKAETVDGSVGADGKPLSAEATITIKETKYIDSVSIGGETNEFVNSGKTIKLNAAISPSDASIFELKWESDNDDVAECYDGYVIGKNPGIAHISAISQDGKNIKATKTVVVEQPIGDDFRVYSDTEQGPQSWMDTASISKTFYARKKDQEEYDVPVTWRVDNKEIATINENTGVLTLTETGKKNGGKVVVTARAKNGNIEGSMEVGIGTTRFIKHERNSEDQLGNIKLKSDSGITKDDTLIIPPGADNRLLNNLSDVEGADRSFDSEYNGLATDRGFENLIAKKVIFASKDLWDITSESFVNSQISEIEFVDQSNIDCIKSSVFFGCKSLKTITGFEKLKKLKVIEPYAFTCSTEESSVEGSLISDRDNPFYFISIEQIQNNAFENQPGIKVIHLPRTIESIGTKAFYVGEGKSGLKYIDYEGTMKEWTKYVNLGEDWCSVAPGEYVVVHCNDGEIKYTKFK